jgi:hypothetical protein
MLIRFLGACLFAATLATAMPEKMPPDAAEVSGNKFTSPYFKFHYTFPQGWSPEDDKLRREKNRRWHEDSIARVQANPPPVINNSSVTTSILWTYELLRATPQPAPADATPAPPHITVTAVEQTSSDSADEQARFLGHLRSVREVVRKPQRQKISGRDFTRTDLVYKNGHLEAVFICVAKGYLLFFRFSARTEQEMNELAQTMNSLEFEK